MFKVSFHETVDRLVDACANRLRRRSESTNQMDASRSPYGLFISYLCLHQHAIKVDVMLHSPRCGSTGKLPDDVALLKFPAYVIQSEGH